MFTNGPSSWLRLRRWFDQDRKHRAAVRKQAEARLEITPDGQLHSANRCGRNWFQLAAAKVAGTDLDQILELFGGQAPGIRAMLLACARRGHAIRLPQPIAIELPAGHRRSLRLSAHPGNGDLTELVLTDISKVDHERLGIRFACGDNEQRQPIRLDEHLLLDRIQQALIRLERNAGQVALLLIDLGTGLAALPRDNRRQEPVQTGATIERLRASLRASDTVIAWSQSECLILLDQLHDHSCVITVASKLLQRLDANDGDTGRALIGVSVGPADSTDAAELLNQADHALYRLRLDDRQRLAFHCPRLDQLAQQHLATSAALQQALARDELQLFYQPQLDLLSGQLSGLEVLLRWESPQRGLLWPADFLPAAEASGLIHEIGHRVIRAALGQLARWRQEGLPIVPIAINLSLRQCSDPDLVAQIRNALGEYGIAPGMLKLELSEDTALAADSRCRELVHELHRLGIRLSVDDFSCTHTAFGLLRQLPLTEIKLPPSLINGLQAGQDGRQMICGAISAARAMGLKVIATGIEAQSELLLLAGNGCTEVQGHLFAHALPVGEVALWSCAPPPHVLRSLRQAAALLPELSTEH